MSLFWFREQQQARGESSAAKRKPVRPSWVGDSTSLSCRQCPLDREPLQHPKMAPTGAGKPVFYSLGEAPGEIEDERGEQFVGKSGELIRDRIPSRWVRFIRWNNTLRCRPPKNRDPAPLELACCRHFQEEDIAATKPAIILVFGGVALQWLTQNPRVAEQVPQITQWRGRRLPVCVRGHVCWAYPLVHPAAFLYMKSSKNYEQRKMYEPSLRCFERDLARVFRDYELGLPKPHVEEPSEYLKGVEIVTEFGATGLRHIEQRLAEIAQRPDVALDIETNGLRPYFIREPRLLSIAVGNYDDTLAFGIDHPEARWLAPERARVHELLYEFLLHSGRKWVHNLKFEQEWLRFLFDDHILYRTKWGDTLAQAHAVDERRGKNLDDIVLRLFGFRLKAVSDLDPSRLVQYPLERVLTYNGLDVKYTDGVRVLQADTISELKVETAYENLVRLTPSLVRMQAKGLVRNVVAIKLLNTSLETEENHAKQAILADSDVRRFRHTHSDFSPTSNPDLLAFFRDFLKVQGLSNVDAEALGYVDHPVARLVLAQRSASKLRSTYVVPLRDGGKHVALDGLVHPQFNHLITITTRLASEDPNAQNFPVRKHKEVRRVIGAPPGHKFVAFDFGQIEARVVAMLSKDPVLIAETQRGEDIHGVWTDKIGARFVPKMLKAEGGRKQIRDGIKNLWTFPELFGNAVEAIALDLSRRFGVDITTRALQPFHDEFWAKYGEVLKWQETLVAFYNERGYVQTAIGFRRHEPMSRNELINHPVQGTAAQIVLDAQYRIDRIAYESERPHWVPIMNVHDDLSFYLPLATLEQDVEGIAGEMCCCPFEFINVPLSVEVSLGDNWCDKRELHTFTTQDFK